MFITNVLHCICLSSQLAQEEIHPSLKTVASIPTPLQIENLTSIHKNVNTPTPHKKTVHTPTIVHLIRYVMFEKQILFQIYETTILL